MSRRGLWLIPLLAATIALLAMLGLRPVSFAERLRRLAGELAGDVPNGRADAIARVDPRDAIGAVNAAYLEALLRGNAHAYAATYHDDGIAVPGTSAIVRGRSAIERAMTHTFSTIRFLEAEMSTVDLRLSGETAVETGHYRFLVNAYSDGVPRTMFGRYAIVWKRIANDWRISLDVAQPGIVEA
jgi:uncharacterized protein (TIGR02246 family)